jgi:hypothetical protein
MKTMSISLLSSRPRVCPLLALAFAALVPLGHARAQGLATDTQAVSTDVASSADFAELADQPLPAFRLALLDLALRAASAHPLNPHARSRAASQDAVVEACLALGQPRRALRCGDVIPGWRRGKAYAGLALYCIQHGWAEAARRCVEIAEAVATQNDADPVGQEWRSQAIRHLCALARGQLEARERGEPAADAPNPRQARLADAAAFDAELQALGAVFASADLDNMKAAAASCVALFGDFYADAERRGRIEAQIDDACLKLPVLIQLDVRMDQADIALQRQDAAKTRALLDQAELTVREAKLEPADEIRLGARIAARRHRADDRMCARSDVDALVAKFDESRDRIVNIWRAGPLRELAEARMAMDDVAGAAVLYARAVEAGVENPNARPRADDLTATCLSMARCGFEPSDALHARLVAICDGLRDPW